MSCIYKYQDYKKLRNWIDPNFHDCSEPSFFYNLRETEDGFTSSYYNMSESHDGYAVISSVDMSNSDNGGEPFYYKYNNYGFRSQHFKNCKPEDVNILFSGCSWTEGTGLPDSMVWRSLLTEKIKDLHPNENVEPYNIGVGGASIPLVFKNTLSFLRKYDKVDYLYILLPGFDRASLFESDLMNEEGGFRKVVYVSPEDEVFKIKTIKRFVLNYEPADAFHTMLPMVKAIEDICELRGIKLYWGTWVSVDQEVYEDFGFNHYVKIPIWERMNTQEEVADKTYFKVAADGGHPGLEHMTEIADAFYEATING